VDSGIEPTLRNRLHRDSDSAVALRTELVRDFLLFSEISREDCAIIVASARECSYTPGKAIFVEGESVQQIVLLTSGRVKLSQSGKHGQEVILRLIGPGESLCAECYPTFSHCSTARAMERSSALVWDAKQFEAVIERFPVLARNVSCVLAQVLNQLEIRFREICTEKVGSRLSSQLVRLAAQIGNANGKGIEIGLSRRDLAQLTGTTLFTVSRMLGRWEEQGFVVPKRQSVVIIDLLALEGLSQTD
jgi:CRP-like cAMP-binding protein